MQQPWPPCLWCSSTLSITVETKHFDQKQVGKERFLDFFSYISRSQSILERNQGRNLRQKAQGTFAYCLAPLAFL